MSSSSSSSRRRRRGKRVIGIAELRNHIVNSETPTRYKCMQKKRKVNIIGVVVEFSFPRKSRGSDYVCILKIVDESCMEVSCSIFSPTMTLLPFLRSHGDIIVLHNTPIEMHGGEVCAVVDKKYSTFGLFSHTHHSSLPYQAYGTFSLSHSDLLSVDNLRTWWPLNHFHFGSTDYLVFLQDIADHLHADLVCKVLHISFDRSLSLWMLFVWDGTDVPPLSLTNKLEDEENNPLPLRIESTPLHQHITRTFTHLGTVLRIIISGTHEDLASRFQAIGKWVRLRNLSFKPRWGMWKGCFNSSSRVRFLGENADVVLERERKFVQRKLTSKNLPIQCSSDTFTVVEDEDEEFHTLLEIITSNKDDMVFQCMVRVVAAYPFLPGYFCSCYKKKEFMMRLTLEDPTARIDAFLCDDEWVKFFGGNPSLDALGAKIKVILGVSEHQSLEDEDLVRSPPWIKCCIYSGDDCGSKLYYIGWTRLKG